MIWRVATRPGKTTLEVIDPEDWNILSTEQQSTYESISEFRTEQEAEKFGKAQVAAANATNSKLPRKYRL